MSQETGKIILRETQDLDSIKSREISFYGNSLNSKENTDSGEIVNTQELAYKEKIKLDNLSNLNNVFEVITKYKGSEFNIIISPENNGEVKEYYRLNNEFIETSNIGIDLQYAISKYEGYLQDEFLYVDGSKDMDNGYYPNSIKSIITKEYLEKFNQGRVVTTDDPTMDIDYEPVLEGDVYTKKNFENGEVDLLSLIPREVDCNYVTGDVLYYDEIEQKFKRYSCKAHIRYFTTQPLTFSDLITRNPTNGYIDIISDDGIYLIYGGGQENVTKVQVLRYGNRTSWKQIAYRCSNMTEFEILATDESKVTYFYSAWQDCSSLTSFPHLDVSNGTYFRRSWENCSSLTSFPVLDVSNGTDFSSAWYGCSSLTSFPELDVSNGTNFTWAWYYCSSLTSFPALDVSNGVNFYGSWSYCSSLTSFPALDVSNGADFSSAWNGCSSLTSFPVLDVSNGTNFYGAWYNCSSLTSFPVLDVSNGTNFDGAWNSCSSLTSFPVLDVSNGTDFYGSWENCSSLTSFPALDVSNGTDFDFAWYGCSSLTSFPVLDVGNGTGFSSAWYGCSSLTSFPVLDVSNGTDFRNAWQDCSSLTSFPALDVSNGTDFRNAWQDCSSLTSFPVLDVSNGAGFSYAWYNCTSLPHCPAGNEITIPSGAITTDMCTGTCCTG